MECEINLQELKAIYRKSKKTKKQLMEQSNLTEKDVANMDSEEHLLGYECGVQFVLEKIFKMIDKERR